MTTPPASVVRQGESAVLAITWTDGRLDRLPYKPLRCSCACARCVHEITGERLLDPASVPGDIAALELSLVGNYALRILWSDGHDTGLFTWERLADLGVEIGLAD